MMTLTNSIKLLAVKLSVLIKNTAGLKFDIAMRIQTYITRSMQAKYVSQ